MAAVDDALAYQQSQINNFTANLPQYQQSLFSQAQDQSANNTLNDYKSIDQNYNARGLLNSGLKEGAKAGAKAVEGSNLASNEAGINNALNNQDYTNKMAGINSGLNNYNGQVQSTLGNYQNKLGTYNQQQGQAGQLLQGAGSIAALAAFSDKRMKKNITSGDKDVASFLDKIPAKKYDYKDEANGKGKQFGLLAQDLEKHPVGKAMIIETPKGKAVDYAKGLATMLAAQSFLHKKLKKISGEKADE